MIQRPGTAQSYTSASFVFANYVNLAGIEYVNAPVLNQDGSGLYGSSYAAELYGGSTVDAMFPGTFNGAPAIAFVAQVLPNGSRGYFRYPNAVVFHEIAGPQSLWLQVRIWDLNLGATYEEVVNKGVGGYGASGVFQDLSGGGVANLPPGMLLHLESFSLVPEPSLALIFVAGLLVLLGGKRWGAPR